ncbi:MAG: hypothetical protein P4L66_15965 [Acetobacteraceae bacterium]|nr:hypothetical protein [Acetobacteraceae bacterium]
MTTPETNSAEAVLQAAAGGQTYCDTGHPEQPQQSMINNVAGHNRDALHASSSSTALAVTIPQVTATPSPAVEGESENDSGGDKSCEDTPQPVQPDTGASEEPAATESDEQKFEAFKAGFRDILTEGEASNQKRNELLGRIAVLVKAPDFNAKAFFERTGIPVTQPALNRPMIAIIKAAVEKGNEPASADASTDPAADAAVPADSNAAETKKKDVRRLAWKWAKGAEFAASHDGGAAGVKVWLDKYGLEAAVRATRKTTPKTAPTVAVDAGDAMLGVPDDAPQQLVVFGVPAGLAEQAGKFTFTVTLEPGKPAWLDGEVIRCAAPEAVTTNAESVEAETGEASNDGTTVDDSAAEQAASIDTDALEMEEAA